MLLYLTRHGETEWNRIRKTQGIRDIPLTDLGRIQAEALGQRLKELKTIDVIYCSDLSRARETAEIIGDKLKLKPIPNHFLREVSFGIWEGLSTKEIETRYPGGLSRWRNDLSFSPKDGESLLSVQGRISSFIRMVEKEHEENYNNILVVSHAVTTKVLILNLMGIPLNLLTRFKISQASLNLLNIEEDNKAILCLNDICHLNE